MPDPIGLPRADALSTSVAAFDGRACSEARAGAARERVAGCDATNRPASPFGDAMAEARQAAARGSARQADVAQACGDKRAARHDTASRPENALRPGCGRGSANDSDDAADTPEEADAPGASNDGVAIIASLHQDNAVTVLPTATISATPPATHDADTPPTDDLAGAAFDGGSRATPAVAVALPADRLPDSAAAATTAAADVSPPAATTVAPAGASPPAAATTDPAGASRAMVANPPARQAAAPPAGDDEIVGAADADAHDTSPTEAAAAGRAGPHAARRNASDESAIARTATRWPEFAGHLARNDARTRPSAGDPGLSPILPHFAAAPGPIHPAPGGAPPVFASVPTPLGHPGFADRFAGEVGALALRGIGQAEIVLNPRELGPVRIELSLNGESARIAFSAAQPETRHAIEQTLPVLKDLLANHGLTLSDTSVSDGRAGDGQNSRFASGQSGARPDAGVPIGRGGHSPHGAAVHRPLGLRGLVDLYV